MKLFFRRFGRIGDQPLVILHGLFGISDNWVTFGKRIADEGFDVVIPDQRNHGLSPHSQVFNYLALTDDLSELLNDQQIANPVLLGHSMGGKVAMRYTLENPDVIKRLVVIDIGLRGYGARPYHRNILDAMLAIDPALYPTRMAIEAELTKKVSEQRIRQFLLKNLHRNDNNMLKWRLNLTGLSDNLNQMFDAIETGKVFNKPVLFIRGGQSDYILPADYPEIRKSFTNAEIITIENASHWVHAEAPEQFYLLSSGFLTGTPDWLSALNE